MLGGCGTSKRCLHCLWLHADTCTGPSHVAQVMTCFLCFVVHMTAVDVRSVGNKGFAPMAIGFTVVLGHAVLLPV